MQRCLEPRARSLVVFASLWLATMVWTAPREARADDDQSAAAIAKLTKKALEDYENLNFDAARRRLAFALEECSRLALTQHPVAAEAHMLMGVVLLSGGDKERAEALAQFEKALTVDATVKLPDSVATPELRQAFDQAAKDVAEQDQPTKTFAKTSAKTETPDDAKAISAPVPARAARPRVKAATETATANADDEQPPRARSWFLGFSLGGGVGWSSGVGEVTDVRVASGFHAAPLVHVVPEVGAFVTPDLLLSVQLRVQFLSGASSEPDPTLTMCGTDHLCSPTKGATAVFAKGTWFLGAGPTVRPYVAGLLGAGQIRHVASVPGMSTCGTDPAQPQACSDTVAAGPVFVGAGGGVAVQLSPAFALLAGANTLLGFSRVTFHVDLNAGAAVEF
jgi:hypothetical protein